MHFAEPKINYILSKNSILCKGPIGIVLYYPKFLYIRVGRKTLGSMVLTKQNHRENGLNKSNHFTLNTNTPLQTPQYHPINTQQPTSLEIKHNNLTSLEYQTQQPTLLENGSNTI